jgi:hypothetical protein
MQPPSFTQILKTEVDRMRTAHPEREGDLAKASALILQGMVTPTEDPATAHVLSSDGAAHYTVNGSCSCQAGQHGKACKHMHAWRLYRHVVRKVEEQAQPVQDDLGNVETPPLGEAPASVNVRVQIAGREVQITLRGVSEDDVLTRLERVLARYPAAPATQPPGARDQGLNQLSPQQHNAAAMHKKVTDFCQVHGLPMQRHENAKGVWYSHFVDGKHCKGR